MPQPKNILFAPLNWGLGHATRCMPLIEACLAKKHHVYIASDGDALIFLQQNYPACTFLELPSYNITYNSNSMLWNVGRKIPSILKTIRSEHILIQQWVKQYAIDLLISDNRYGCWHEQIPSIFICHQLAPRLPFPFKFLQSGIRLFHLNKIKPFTACWIPDNRTKPHLSGSLSHGFALQENFHYIGLLSRYANKKPPTQFSIASLNQLEIDIAIILSGPEPQRSHLEAILLEQSLQLNRKLLIVQGKPESFSLSQNRNVTQVSFLNNDDIHQLLTVASVIISRSGYSSLMDYAALGAKQVILIPTPGQTEQLYLASLLAERNTCSIASQENINLKNSLEEVKTTIGFTVFDGKAFFNQKLNAVLK